jgi:gas vesicle protein
MGNPIVKKTDMARKVNGVFIGMLIGGLTGAAAMLLFAPQTGKHLRANIQRKSIQWRDRMIGLVKNTLAHIRSDTRAVTADLH